MIFIICILSKLSYRIGSLLSKSDRQSGFNMYFQYIYVYKVKNKFNKNFINIIFINSTFLKWKKSNYFP